MATDTSQEAAGDPLAGLRAEAAYEIAHPPESVLAAVTALGLRPGMRVLDIGCGPGAHLGLFADAVDPGGEVVGLDIAPKHLSVAAELCAERVATGALRVVDGDLHALPFEAGTFDVAWSSATLHHEVEPGAVLAEWARVVRPGGAVAVMDGDSAGSFPLLPWPRALEQRLRAAAFRAAEEHYGGKLPYHFDGYIGRRLPRLLREAGLTEVSFHAFADVDRAPLDPPREAELRGWFLGWFAGRLADFLAPHDHARFAALFDPRSADYLLGHPDFFHARTRFMAVGRVPERGADGASHPTVPPGCLDTSYQ